MRADALSTIASVRHFLTSQLLDAVPQSLRSELRSAVKNLADAEAELDAAGGRIDEEDLRLLDLCRQALAILPPEAGLEQQCVDLEADGIDTQNTFRLRLDRQARVLALTTAVLLRLQGRVGDEEAEPQREVLGMLYRELGAQAILRSRWQSVFDVS